MEDPIKIYNDVVKIANEEFREEDHPRDSDGKFTDKDNETPKTNDMSRSISTQYGRGKASFDMGTNWLMKQNGIDYPEEFEELDKTIADYYSLERWEELKQEWDDWISENPDAKGVIDKIQKQVDEFNGIMKEKYENSEVFYRGTDINELFDLDQSREFESENYDFTSLTMNEEQVKTTYNKGVIIELDGDFVRDNSSLVKYVAEPTKIQAFGDELDGSIDPNDVESTDTPVNALYVDEQEARIKTWTEIKPENIKRVTINLGDLRGRNFEQRIEDWGLKGNIKNEYSFFVLNKEEIREAIRKNYEILSEADIVLEYEKSQSLFL